MTEDNINTIAKIVTSIGGAFLTVFFTNWISQRSEERSLRKNINQRYIFQLQYVAESLGLRLYNIGYGRGKSQMNKRYFIMSMLYALGSVFAYDRIMLIEGIYAKLMDKPDNLTPSSNANDNYGSWLKEKLEKIHSCFKDEHKFYRYSRIALADTIIERTNNGLNISTFTEFVNKDFVIEIVKNDKDEELLLFPAKEF